MPTRPSHGPRRLADYDYTQAGAYFVTLVTLDRTPVFGEIVDDVLIPSVYGPIVQQAWEDLPNHYPHVILDIFMVMPNHVHGILFLIGDPPGGDHSQRTPTGPPGRRPLPEIVRAFKTSSARRINAMRGTPGTAIWQRNYYEHVIRREADLDTIRAYIQTNPERWHEDSENPGN